MIVNWFGLFSINDNLGSRKDPNPLAFTNGPNLKFSNQGFDQPKILFESSRFLKQSPVVHSVLCVC